MEWIPRGLPNIHAPIPICGENNIIIQKNLNVLHYFLKLKTKLTKRKETGFYLKSQFLQYMFI